MKPEHVLKLRNALNYSEKLLRALNAFRDELVAEYDALDGDEQDSRTGEELDELSELVDCLAGDIDNAIIDLRNLKELK